ncbi:MAG TPA: hypothetical protein PLK90_05075 [Clostridiales bacterium]|nr:hypothetical protein [Clostridiales bacterium]HQP69755.1 hypothetical protein [Clostridiales bacterium]
MKYFVLFILLKQVLILSQDYTLNYPISLEISSPDSIYQMGDPVQLKLLVKNLSDSVITIPYSPYFQQFINTQAVCGSDTIQIDHPSYSLGHGRNPSNQLQPGKCIEYPLLNKNILLEDGNHGDHVFYKPGIYKLFCSYVKIRSNEIILKIIDMEPK